MQLVYVVICVNPERSISKVWTGNIWASLKLEPVGTDQLRLICLNSKKWPTNAQGYLTEFSATKKVMRCQAAAKEVGTDPPVEYKVLPIYRLTTGDYTVNKDAI